MKLFFAILSILFLCAGPSVYAQTTMSYEEAFKELKTVLTKRDFYLQEKLKRLAEEKQQLTLKTNPSERFESSKFLFHKYYDLKIDSALYYAEQMLSITEKDPASQKEKRQEAILCIALTYGYTGMYKECEELLDREFVDTEILKGPIRELYHKVNLELHRGLREHVNIGKDKKAYKEKVDADIDSLVAYVPKSSVWYNIYYSSQLKTQRRYDEALTVLFEAFNKMSTDDREMAQVAFFISDLYRLKKDQNSRKLYLAISAITDVKYAVKEYVSLWKLGVILYEEGDIDVAYRFIETSLQDATYSGAYRWVQQITKMLPRIYEAYNTKIIKQRNAIFGGFVIITFLLAGLVWQFRKLRRNKRKLGSMNEHLKVVNKELNHLSEDLHLSNVKMEVANSQLKYLNKELISESLLKETYLTKFIDLCSDYLDKLDDYRINLKRVFKGGNMEVVKKELASSAYIEEEYKAFLLNFDETFLNLYPNFVTEFNNLFPEEEKQEIKKNELLTTELRIYALIRLGIADSGKIARFLKCSITTIYTYRSKVRNKSLCPESFEDKIRDFQREQYISSSFETA